MNTQSHDQQVNKVKRNFIKMKSLILICLAFLLNQGCSGLLGGWKNEDVTDVGTIAIAKACIQELDASSNSMYLNKLMTLKSARSQVVAGEQWEFVFDMAETTCSKLSESVNLEDCAVGRDIKECNVTVWFQPWLKSQEVTAQSCIKKEQGLVKTTNLKWTGMEQNKLDGNQQQWNKQNPNATLKLNQKKPLLGGGDHDFANYGEFSNFKEKYNKKYVNKQEEILRFEIYRENMKKVQLLQKHEKGDATYGATEFADMSEEEFRKTHLTPRWNIKYDPQAKIADIPKVTPPASWDWRVHNAVTPVKNQGSCGSCWAFSTTGNVEGQWALKKGNLVSLSEQELVDCDKVDQGCNGGLPIDAYKAIIKLGGLEDESDYPYQGDDEKCSFKKAEAKVDINGYVNISSDEGDMAAWLYKNGPISIGINAMAMQFYFGGVSHPWSILCSPQDLDHGVLIVGYGVKKTGIIFPTETPFWIIKNSWGPSWGESGYYLVYRGSGVCGLNQMPTSAVVN